MAEAELSAEATCMLGVKIMSWSFFGLFAGFGAAQALQSSLNKTLGFINLACLYFMFVIVGLLCPRFINTLVAKCGWRPVLICSAFAYILMIISNLDTASSGWIVQPIANAILGAGAAFLWTTQNVYFGQCSHLVGTAVSTTQGGSAAEAIANYSTRFNSYFFGVFQFSNSTGNLVSSALLLAFKGMAWLRYLLFFVLSFAAMCGGALFLLLPNIEQTRPQDEAPSVGAALRMATDVKFFLILPWIITNGMTFAFVNGDYTSDIVSPLLGPGYVGFLMTVFFGVDAFFSMCWGKLIEKRCISRRVVFTCAGLLWIAFLLVKMFWTRDPNFDRNQDWKKLPDRDVSWQDIALCVLLAMLAGAADGFWTPGPPAVLQSFFSDSPNLTATMAAYKAFQSLGFAVQFTLGATLEGYPMIRDVIVLCCCCVSLVSVLSLDILKQPLDPRAATVLTTALNAEEAGKTSA